MLNCFFALNFEQNHCILKRILTNKDVLILVHESSSWDKHE